MDTLYEVLCTYTDRPTLVRRYLLTQLGATRPSFDSSVLVTFLARESASPESEISSQARQEHGRVLSDHSACQYGLVQEPAARGAAERPSCATPGATRQDAAAGFSDPDRNQILAAAATALGSILPVAQKRLGDDSGHVGRLASMILGLSPLASVEAFLAEASLARGGFQCAAALSEIGSTSARQSLLAMVRTLGAERPDLIPLIRAVPTRESLPLLDELSRHTSSYGRAAVAQALVPDLSPDTGPLLRRLLADDHVWVTVHALEALRRHPAATHLPLVIATHDRSGLEYVKVQCLLAAGAIPSPDTLAFLERALDCELPRAQAAAMEGLARLGHFSPPVIAAALRLLRCPLLRTRVNATLLLLRHDPDRAREALHGLLVSGQTAERVEGAYVLGYLEGPESAQVLGEMACRDPSSMVRTQAVKSLVRHSSGPAGEALQRCITLAPGSTARLAIRALAHSSGERNGGALEAIQSALEVARLAEVRADLLRALGILAADRAFTLMHSRVATSLPAEPPKAPSDGVLDRCAELLARGLADDRPVVAMGALDGLRAAGDAISGVGAGPLLTNADPGVRARSAVAHLLTADPAGSSVLQAMVASDDEPVSRAGFEAVLEFLSVVPSCVESERYGKLARQLHASRRSLPPEPDLAPDASPVAPAPLAPDAAHAAPGARSVAPDAGARGRKIMAGVEARIQDAYARSAHDPLDGAAGSAGERWDEATYTAALNVGPAPRREWPRLRPWVATIPLFLALLLILRLGHRGAGADTDARLPHAGPTLSRALKPGEMAVDSVEGKGLVTSPGGSPEELVTGRAISPGRTITTGAGARLTLVDGVGNTVTLGPASGVRLGEPTQADASGAGQLWIDPIGDVLIDSRGIALGEVQVGQSRVRMKSATARFWDTESGRTITVVIGDVELKAPDGNTQTLSAGESAALAREP